MSPRPAYVLSGVARWWVGDRLDEVREARAGDFVFIPPHVVHWEQNASDSEPVEMVVARSTQDAVVVVVEDHPHAPEHARSSSVARRRRRTRRSGAGCSGPTHPAPHRR